MNAIQAKAQFEANKILRIAREREEAEAAARTRYAACRKSKRYVGDEDKARELCDKLVSRIAARVRNGEGRPYESVSLELSAPGYTPEEIHDGISDENRKLLRDPDFVAPVVATMDLVVQLFTATHSGFLMGLNHQLFHGYDGDHTVSVNVTAHF